MTISWPTRLSKKVAKKFWTYMNENNLLLPTRTELRTLYVSTFRPTLDESEQKVPFCDVMWVFRGKMMRVIEWKPAGHRENIVYRMAVDKGPEDVIVGLAVAELKKRIVSDRLLLAADKGGIIIEPQPDKDGVVYLDATVGILQLTVINVMEAVVVLRCYVLGLSYPFIVDDRFHHIVSEEKTAELSAHESIDFTVTLTGSPNPGIYSIPVAFMFRRGEGWPFHIVKYVRAEIVDDNDIVRELQPTTPYVRPRRDKTVNEPDIEIIKGEPPPMQAPKIEVPLSKYPIPDDLPRQVKRGEAEAALERLSYEEITPASHCQKFSKLLHVEELQMEIDIERYKMEKAKLIKEERYLTLAVPGLAENRPSLVRGDRLFVKKLNADGVTAEKKEYEGYVHQVELNKVFLKFSSSFHRDFLQNSSYEVRFKFSRTTLRVMHRALEKASLYLEDLPYDGHPCFVHDHVERRTLSFFDILKVGRNAEQRQAVENIVAGTSRPYPYLVFGPPGTGKTVTIVEAIKQVLKNFPNSKVLACAPSNSAADLILERVSQHLVVPKTQMVRLNAFGRHESSVNKKIVEFCRRSDDGFYLPSKKEIEQDYRLVVTTLITAGRLQSLGVRKGHFTHLFIDEAGQGMEPECLVPIVGLLGTPGSGGGQVVLAGDPKQLGPVLRSPLAIKFGLGMSFLERLMSPQFSCFNRQAPTNDYDARVVTKLLNNYRSHPSIIELPNKMFYDNELRACADELLRNALCDWDGLKTKGFPVIFEAVCGKDQREENSPSFFNPEEVAVVLRYVRNLKDARRIPLKTSEIGIISPYHKQVQKIRQGLKKKPVEVNDIKVGSVEEFQGQERKVIIISTVRSSEEFLQLDAEHKLGFLKNPKRFNVAITRAKALLVVVGNPHVLCRDWHWRRFIGHCLKYGSFSGSGSGSNGPAFQMPEETDEELAEQFDKLCLNDNELAVSERDLTGADYEHPAWRPGDQ